MHDARQGAPPDRPGEDPDPGQVPGEGRRPAWIADVIPSGLALALPALAFTAAAYVFYPPAAHAMAPVAIGLTFVGIGLVLVGIVAGRRL